MVHRHVHTDDETQGLANADALLTEALNAFAKDRVVLSDIGSNAAECLRGAIEQKDLPKVQSVIRESLCVCLLKPGFDSEPYWALIDAIGFFCDAHPGTWPYMTHDGRLRRIAWSLEMAETVRSRLH